MIITYNRQNIFIIQATGVTLALALTRVVNYAPRVTLQIVPWLNDDSRRVIYNHNIVYSTGHCQFYIFYTD
jgi:hypothetical protein